MSLILFLSQLNSKAKRSLKSSGKSTFSFFQAIQEFIEKSSEDISKLSMVLLLDAITSSDTIFDNYLESLGFIKKSTSILMNPFIFKKLDSAGNLSRVHKAT